MWVPTVWAAHPAADPSQLVAAFPATSPPHYDLDAEGRPTGFAIETLEAIARRSGLTIHYAPQPNWAATLDTLRQGRAGIIPNLGISPARQAEFDFTEPLESFPVVIFVRTATSDIDELHDLAGKRVGSVGGNISAQLLRQHPELTPALYVTVEQALFGLLSNDVDALIYPEPWVWGLARKAGVADKIRRVGPPLLEIKRAIAIGKDHPQLLARLNQAVREFRGSHEYQTIYTRWFGQPTSYWTLVRLAVTLLSAAGLVLALVLLWHYRATLRINRRLETNIRERERMEAALCENELRLRNLTQVTPVGIFRTDAQGQCLYVNETWQSMTGLSLQQALGDGWLQALHPDDRERVFLAWQQSTQAQQNSTVEYRFQHVDGRIVWVLRRATPERDSHGNIIGFIGSVTDITELRTAEIALRESEQRWRSFTETSPDHIMLLDRDGRILFLNHKLPGISREEAIGTLAYRYLPEDSQTMMRDCCDRVFRKKQPQKFQTQYPGEYGQMLYFDSLVSPVMTDDEVNAVVLSARNITDRKQIEAELQRHQEHLEELVKFRTRELEASNAELENFSYSISHDLRAPLRRIEGFGQVLKEDYSRQLDAEGQNAIERMCAGARQMSRYIDDMLQLSRITRAQLNYSRIDVSHLAGSLVHRLQEQSHQRQIAIQIQDGIHVVADRHLLNIALQNLLDNAWKFTANSDSPRIEIGQTNVDGHEAIFVCDNGLGFNMDYVNKLFVPFQRLHSEGNNTGSGMGLATVARIVHRHNGEVWGKSEPGKGACIYFTLGKHSPEDDPDNSLTG
jgi:PAS domain S-box-containing protein